MIAALVVILFAAPAAPLVRLPTPAELVAAVRSGDAPQLEALAARLGVRKLLRLAERGTGVERSAAVRALPLVDDAWAVLPELARLVRDADSEVAARAADAVRRIAEALTPEAKARDEVPDDVPARAARELAAEAALGSLRAPLRIEAMQALAALRGVTRIDEAALVRLFGDRDPKIRHAVAEALAGSPAGDKALADAVAHDPAKDVAAAAAASLCRDVPVTPPAAPRGARADAHALALGATGRQRLRALALDEQIELADRLDLINCLRVAPKPADQKVLDELARRPPESLRRRARALGGR